MAAVEYSGKIPAERASWEELHAQIAAIHANERLIQILGELPDEILLLNQNRQIIYVNEVALKCLGVQDPAEVYGCRPGEVFGCVHASQGPGGCGTTEHCSFCGGLRVIMNSLNGYADMQKCRITRAEGAAPLDMIVHGIPIHLLGMSLSLVCCQPSVSEKNKQVAVASFRVQRYAAYLEEI